MCVWDRERESWQTPWLAWPLKVGWLVGMSVPWWCVCAGRFSADGLEECCGSHSQWSEEGYQSAVREGVFSPVGVTGFLATSHGLFTTPVRDKSIYPAGPLEPCPRVLHQNSPGRHLYLSCCWWHFCRIFESLGNMLDAENVYDRTAVYLSHKMLLYIQYPILLHCTLTRILHFLKTFLVLNSLAWF